MFIYLFYFASSKSRLSTSRQGKHLCNVWMLFMWFSSSWKLSSQAVVMQNDFLFFFPVRSSLRHLLNCQMQYENTFPERDLPHGEANIKVKRCTKDATSRVQTLSGGANKVTFNSFSASAIINSCLWVSGWEKKKKKGIGDRAFLDSGRVLHDDGWLSWIQSYRSESLEGSFKAVECCLLGCLNPEEAVGRNGIRVFPPAPRRLRKHPLQICTRNNE